MNSLEIINEKIEMQKVAKEAALKIIKEFEGIALVNAYKEEVKYHDKEIQMLEQIKAELEAWEVVKKFIIDSNGVYLLRLDSDDDYDNKYCQILKKALEVEDE